MDSKKYPKHVWKESKNVKQKIIYSAGGFAANMNHPKEWFYTNNYKKAKKYKKFSSENAKIISV